MCMRCLYSRLTGAASLTGARDVAKANRRFVSLELIKQRSEDSTLPSLSSIPRLEGDTGEELLKTNAGRPLRVPPRPSPPRGGGGGSGSGGGRRPTPPRPQPATVRDSGATTSASTGSSNGSGRSV
ncbi:hypothetical protein VOLCADRAFT_87169, partial [Volvox carteri f. nagariensis]